MNFIKNLKNLFLKIKFDHIKKDINLSATWYGSKYGGFNVYDKILSKNDKILSFGVGEDITFDEELIQYKKCIVFAFDPTPKSIKFISNKKEIKNFKFFNVGISNKSGKCRFNLPINDNYVSGSLIFNKNHHDKNHITVKMKSFNDILHQNKLNNISLVKLDIEGEEYNIYKDIINHYPKIPQICLEIHERFFSDGCTKTKTLLKDFRNNDYLLFGISDSYEELSFIHKDFI